MFERLVTLNCFSKNKLLKNIAKNLLEKFYGCEINCTEIDKSVLFAHHARGCTIAASEICENVVIYQNVTIGSNMRYHKTTGEWENIGGPIIGKNVVIADGAKILGPIIIGENSVVGAGAIITKDMPANSVIYGVNQYKPKDPNYDLVFNKNMVDFEKIIETNNKLIEKYKYTKQTTLEFISINPQNNYQTIKDDFLKELIKNTLEFYNKTGFVTPWISYLVKANNDYVGICAFKGKPNNNKIEIAYCTRPNYENCGYAAEMCKKLIEIAQKENKEIKITARTLPEKNASTKVLEKNGFINNGIILDDNDGEVFEWIYR